MLSRILLVSACVLGLSACSSLNGLLTFEDAADDSFPAVAAAPAPAPAAPDTSWCQRVAASDRMRAQQDGFDPATLDRMTLQSFQQCQSPAQR